MDFDVKGRSFELRRIFSFRSFIGSHLITLNRTPWFQRGSTTASWPTANRAQVSEHGDCRCYENPTRPSLLVIEQPLERLRVLLAELGRSLLLHFHEVRQQFTIAMQFPERIDLGDLVVLVLLLQASVDAKERDQAGIAIVLFHAGQQL